LRADCAQRYDQADETRVPERHKPDARKSHRLVGRDEFLYDAGMVCYEAERAHVGVRRIRSWDRRIGNDNGFFRFNIGLLGIGGELDGCLGANVERLCLEEKAKNERDGGEDDIDPMDPRNATGSNDVATAGTSEERTERKEDSVDGLEIMSVRLNHDFRGLGRAYHGTSPLVNEEDLANNIG